MSRRKPSIAKRLIFALIAVVLFFVAAEIGLRLMPDPEVDETDFTHASVTWRADANSDKLLPHREENTSFAVTTDANGLRPPWHQTKVGTRILAMGCSTTFGWGVADHETYPFRLQERLTAMGKQVQVINGGQPGYTSFQGLWLWDEALGELDADVVLLGFVVQDARRAAYSDLSQALLQKRTNLVGDWRYEWALYRFLLRQTGRWQSEAKERGTDEQDMPHRVSPEDYLENLRALIRRVQDSGGTPVLFGYPLEVEGYTELHRAIMKNLAVSEGVPHLDPSELTRNRSDYYFVNDRGHANAAGNDAIAEAVAQFLVAEGLIQ